METNDFIKDLEVDFCTLLTDEDGNDELRNILDQVQDTSKAKKLVMEYCRNPEHEDILRADINRLIQKNKWICTEARFSDLYKYYFTNKAFLGQFFQDMLDIGYEYDTLDEFEIDTEGKLIKYKGTSDNVIIPNNVVIIGDGAFIQHHNLTNATIPNSVVKIEEYAFAFCPNLTNVTFEENSKLTYIDNNVFYDCSKLENIVIPDSVIDIGFGAFMGCDKLTNVKLSNNLTKISSYLFTYCFNLSKIEIPAKVTSIDFQAFYDCSKLSEVLFKENSSLTHIDREAFWNCRNLTDITLPNTITNMAEKAFKPYKRLTIKSDSKYVKNYCEENAIKYEAIAK